MGLLRLTAANEKKTLPSVVLMAGIRHRLMAEREEHLTAIRQRRSSLLCRIELAERASRGPMRRLWNAVGPWVPMLIPVAILATLMFLAWRL